MIDMNKRTLLALCTTTALSGSLLVGSGLPSAAAPLPARYAPSQGDVEPQRILLTNDDGWRGVAGADTPLIVELRDALMAEGHDVTVVAPATDQSGRGTSISQTPLTVENPEPGVYTVSGTPRDAVNLAIDVIMQGDPPDLVVSGMNPGGNSSIVTNASGTMGAATRAAERGLPAVAISIDSLATGAPEAAADEAAAYAVGLVETLAEHPDRLDPGEALNVNYPSAPAVGTKLTTVDPQPYIELHYKPVPGQQGTYQVAFAPSAETPTTGSDWDALQDGYVSITPVSVDPTADREDVADLRFLTKVPVS